MGGVRRIREKLRAYAHQENNTGRFADPSHLGEALRGSRDLFGRGIQWRTVGVQDLPAYVSEHRLRFRDWLYDPALLGDQPAVQDRCAALLDLYHSVVHLPGDVVLLGSAEDEAAIALANACCPDTLWAADDEFDRRTAGPLDAGPRGSGGCSGSGDFVRRLRLLTAGNVQLVSLGPVQFLKGHPVPLRFALAGSAHCLAVSRATLLAARAALLPGGIICGFSYGPRVSAALDELLPGYQQSDALWWWQR
jgi:hypothetical protein